MEAFLREKWMVLPPCVIGFGAIYLLLPQASRRKPIWAGGAAALALVLCGMTLVGTGTSTIETVLFLAFSGSAIVAGVAMITQSNPVHAALSFALVVLSTCGLFLLQAAPFLMAATIIIYAGAIVVTFLFVIMLAQQEGVSNADQRSREPFMASLAVGVLLASLWGVVHRTYHPGEPDDVIEQLTKLKDAKDANDVKRIFDPSKAEVGKRTPPLVDQLAKQFPEGPIRDESENLRVHWNLMRLKDINNTAGKLLAAVTAARNQHGVLALNDVPGKAKTPGHYLPGQLPAGNVAAIGRTLFTDYLIPVELAATLLLVATIGAIVIAGRRSEELR